MKTLDEVIGIVTECKANFDAVGCFSCHYSNHIDCVSGCVLADALNYLREYQERLQNLQDMMDRYDISVKNYEEAVENCRVAEQKYWRNTNNVEDMSPLSWDELKKMDMKPVWYESLYWGVKTWAMVLVQKEGIYIDWYRRCQDGQTIKGNRYEIYKDQQGEVWQVYRKERG